MLKIYQWFSKILPISMPYKLVLVLCSLIAFVLKLEHETWGGDTYITHVVPTNLWIGPTKLTLIQLGAMFAPCVRTDITLSLRSGLYVSYTEMGLGCCEIPGRGAGEILCDIYTLCMHVGHLYFHMHLLISLTVHVRFLLPILFKLARNDNREGM